jgi:hypothetical protein
MVVRFMCMTLPAQLYAAVVFALLIGCAVTPPAITHPVSISSEIAPVLIPTKKVPARVAVSCIEPLRSYRYHVDAIQVRKSRHSYDFAIGSALCKALLRSVGTAYTAPALVSKAAPGAYETVITFALHKSQIEISFEDTLKLSARALSVFAVSVELFDGRTMRLLHSSVVDGKAFLIRAIDQVSSREAEKVFAAAIEMSIQQLSDDTALLLAKWAAELSPP